MATSKITYEPLLRIEYAWEGCFEFDQAQPGHSWHYSEKQSWKRTKLKIIGDGSLEKVKLVQDLKFGDAATRYKGTKQTVLRKATAVLGERVSAPEWQLMAWYETTNPKSKSPVVGRSHSLILNSLVSQSTLRPFSLVSTFAGRHLTADVRELGMHIPSWFYLPIQPFEDLDEYLISLPELFLVQKKKTAGGTGEVLRSDIDSTLRKLMNVRCKHDLEVLKVEQADGLIRVTLRDSVKISEYAKGAICNCIPVPGKTPRKGTREEPEGVNSPEVVVSSPVVGGALAELTRIWQDPRAKSVLISSPPGSGKEVFASSIPVGNGRPTDRIQTLSMASDDQSGIERQLYGYKREDGTIQDGLIALATGSALFLDEVHQPTKDSLARKSLLRTLEADTYYPMQCSVVRDVKNVLWVMATSIEFAKLKEYKPPDFWTRVGHAVRIEHPLNWSEATGAGLQGVVGDFFKTFWWDLCDRQYGIDPITDPNKLPSNMIPSYWQQYSMIELIRPGKDLSTTFARIFLRCLASFRMQPQGFSIRGLRNLVARLFAIAWADHSQGRDPWSKKGARNTVVFDKVAFDKDVKRIFAEIRQVASLN